MVTLKLFEMLSARAKEGPESPWHIRFGNHFMELQTVENLVDLDTANEWGDIRRSIGSNDTSESRGLEH